MHKHVTVATAEGGGVKAVFTLLAPLMELLAPNIRTITQTQLTPLQPIDWLRGGKGRESERENKWGTLLLAECSLGGIQRKVPKVKDVLWARERP